MKLDSTWKDFLLNPGAHCPGSSLGLFLLRISMAGSTLAMFSAPSELDGTLLMQGMLYALGLGTRLLPFLLLVSWGLHPEPWAFLGWQSIAVQVALSLTGAGSFSLDAKLTRARGYLPCAGSD